MLELHNMEGISVKGINREIFSLALPSILANITVPIVGMVDIAVAGHQPEGGLAAATFIGGASIGSLLFDLLYWNFSFLRVGTGGMTAQAYGRGDMRECANILVRGLGISFSVAAVFWLLQWVFVQFAFLFIDCTPEVRELASQYFYIRIIAAPATLSLMAFKGWLIGMQDGISPMITDLVVNGMNIVVSILLSLGFSLGSFTFGGIGFSGIAWGTVVAQYSGLAAAVLLVGRKFRRKVFTGYGREEIRAAFRGGETRRYFTMNIDLVVRSLSFIGIYAGFSIIAAHFGDMTLAVSSIMLQILLLFSYFTDGFAYAGEAMSGKYIGAGNRRGLRLTVRYTFIWSAAVCLVFMAFYGFGGHWMLEVMTSDADVIDACAPYMFWLFVMPVFGCIAFTWDGIYIGATAARPIRNTMIISTLAFLASYFILAAFFHPDGVMAVHLLLAAYFVHLVVRSAALTVDYRKTVLSRTPEDPGK